MIGMAFDFSLPPSIGWALVAGLALPLYLIVVSRLPMLAGRPAVQFLVSTLIMTALWLVPITVASAYPPRSSEVLVGSMILIGASLFYLEVWALLSRGYTLSLLVTLHRAKKPLDEKELADRYHGGDGISWVMKHRVSGLVDAGLVREQDGMVVLNDGVGSWVAHAYRASIRILGLRRTG